MNKKSIFLFLLMIASSIYCSENVNKFVRSARIAGKRGGLFSLAFVAPTLLFNNESIAEKVVYPLGASMFAMGVSGAMGALSTLLPVKITDKAVSEQLIRDFRAKSVGSASGTAIGITALAWYALFGTMQDFYKKL